MRKRWLLAVLLLVAGGILAVALGRQPVVTSASATDPIGAVVAVDPSAAIAAVTARMDAPVHANDLVTTRADGAIRVRFADATFFSVGANSNVRIDSFVFDPQRNASKMVLNVTRGAFRFVSGEPIHAYPGQEAIRTPVANLGIRGTGLVVVVGPEAEALYRRMNTGYVSDGGDRSQATLILLTGGMIDVIASGTPITLAVPGNVLFFSGPGVFPVGTAQIDAAFRAEIVALASPPSLGPEPGSPTPPAIVPKASDGDADSPNGGKPRPSPAPIVSPEPQPSRRPDVIKPTPTPASTPGTRPEPRPSSAILTRVPLRPSPTPRPTRKPVPPQ